jgi:DNA-binding GntR family transcriptional regulator
MREHWELLRLCRAGATAKAVQLLEAHIAYAQKSVIAPQRKAATSAASACRLVWAFIRTPDRPS